MSKHSDKAVRAKSPRGANSAAARSGGEHSGRQLQDGQPRGSQGPGRGSALQGARQNARGGPAGANQGGAPRGTSRLEPSTAKKGTGRVSGKRQTQKGRGRTPK